MANAESSPIPHWSVPIEDLLPAGGERDEIEGEIRDIIRAYRNTLAG